RRSTEERHEHALAARSVLVEEDADHAAAGQRAEDRSQGRPLVDQLDAELSTKSAGQHFQPRRIEGPDDDAEPVGRKPAGGGQKLPVAEMGGEEQRPAMAIHHRPEMLDAVDPHSGQDVGQRTRQQRDQLDDHRPEVLIGRATDPAPLLCGRSGKGLREVRQGDAATAGRQRVPEIAEPPADVRGGARRQPVNYRAQRSKRYIDGVDGLRRSRRISMPMGMTDSTITISTTMWMWRSMSGTALPRR